MPDSGVAVRILEGRWTLRLTLPRDRLAMALISTGRMADPGPGFQQYPVPRHVVVERYVLDSLAVKGADGRAWPLTVTSMAEPAPDARDWRIDVEARAPSGDARSGATLFYDVIIRDVIPDAAIVTVEQDWDGGLLPGHPRVLGKLEEDRRTIRVGGEAGGRFDAWLAMVGMGVSHIAQGPDHIAFLVTLLLTATLLARGRAWLPQPDNRLVLANTLWRVSAFTLGHTVSLLVTSLGWLPEAGQGIEVLIAISVGLSAAHALRPFYPGKEAFVAGGFGLVHGMAFATAIRELALPTSQTVLATLFFNLGIEAAQLAIVALVLPVLLALRGTGAEGPLRWLVSGVALAAAIYWAMDRAFTF